MAGKRSRGSPLPYLLVLAGCAAGFWWMLHGRTNGARGGSLTVAGALLLAALARLVLPERTAGLLASRTRTTDVVTFATLAAGLLAASLLL